MTKTVLWRRNFERISCMSGSKDRRQVKDLHTPGKRATPDQSQPTQIIQLTNHRSKREKIKRGKRRLGQSGLDLTGF